MKRAFFAFVLIVSAGIVFAGTGCRPKPLADDEVFAICGQALQCEPELKKTMPTQADCAAAIRSRVPKRDAACSDVATQYERCVLQRARCNDGKFEAPDCDRERQAKLACNPALDGSF